MINLLGRKEPMWKIDIILYVLISHPFLLQQDSQGDQPLADETFPVEN